MSTAMLSLRERHTNLANELEKARPRLAAVIPIHSGLDPSRAAAVILSACSRNPAILDCTIPSIVRTVAQAAELGLELGGPIGEAYLVPFEDRKKQRTMATLIVGYKGFLKLGHGSFDPARLVRRLDVFEYEFGTSPKIIHKPGAGTIDDRGEVVAAYATAQVAGRVVFDVMDRVELNRIRDGARAKWGPWKEHTDEMYRKCPVRRLAKYLDLNPLTRKACEFDDISAMQRGEVGTLTRDGFDGARGAELKALLAAKDKPAEVIDADFEEG